MFDFKDLNELNENELGEINSKNYEFKVKSKHPENQRLIQNQINLLSKTNFHDDLKKLYLKIHKLKIFDQGNTFIEQNQDNLDVYLNLQQNNKYELFFSDKQFKIFDVQFGINFKNLYNCENTKFSFNRNFYRNQQQISRFTLDYPIIDEKIKRIQFMAMNKNQFIDKDIKQIKNQVRLLMKIDDYKFMIKRSFLDFEDIKNYEKIIPTQMNQISIQKKIQKDLRFQFIISDDLCCKFKFHHKFDFIINNLAIISEMKSGISNKQNFNHYYKFNGYKYLENNFSKNYINHDIKIGLNDFPLNSIAAPFLQFNYSLVGNQLKFEKKNLRGCISLGLLTNVQGINLKLSYNLFHFQNKNDQILNYQFEIN